MKSAVPPLDPFAFSRFRPALLRWYAKHARDLPWRRTRDPYRVWISEIMLQQTTVTAVVPYFERFLKRFATVHELAAAEEEDVLRLWEGLGYYSRARNIHRTARQIVADRGGRFPWTVDELLALPGIGRYTAGAIASFAFDRRAPIVEANTLRLYCRLLGYDGDPRSADGQRVLWEFAEAVLPRKFPGQFNQALMELGATVCTPDNPACDRCPVRTCCRALADGRHAEIPRPAKRPETTEVTEIAVAVRRNGKLLLIKRPPGERWAGLWDFVRFAGKGQIGEAVKRGNGKMSSRAIRVGMPGTRPTESLRARCSEPAYEQSIAATVHDRTGLKIRVSVHLADLRHTVTRFRITLRCYLAECISSDDGALPVNSGKTRWVLPADFARYPLSVTGRHLAELLQKLIPPEKRVNKKSAASRRS